MVENVNVALIHHSPPTWAELSTRTFDCSFEEDLAAPAGENSIMTTWGLIRANHADFTPTLSLHSWRRSDTFLSVGGTGERRGKKYRPKLKTLHLILFKSIVKSSRGIEIYLQSSPTCAFMSSKSNKGLVTIWALKDKMICNLWWLPKSSGCHDSTFFLWLNRKCFRQLYFLYPAAGGSRALQERSFSGQHLPFNPVVTEATTPT